MSHFQDPSIIRPSRFALARKGEQGSALWFILIAVALLGLLTVTIGRVSETVDQSGEIERYRVIASDLMRFAGGLDQAIEQMRLRGVSENEISFETSDLAGYTNARCTSDNCLLFDRGGGGMTYKSPNSTVSSSDWLFTGANSIVSVGTDGTGTGSSTDNELLAILPGISEGLCLRINAELDIAGIPQDTGQSDIATKYTGTFPNGLVIENPAGEKTGCFEGNQDDGGGDISGTYYFYHTLIAR